MYLQIDIFDLAVLVLLFGVYIFYNERKHMSASSNLKDAVVMLDNSHNSLLAAVSTYVAAKANGASEAEIQAAADKINSIAVALQAAVTQVTV